MDQNRPRNAMRGSVTGGLAVLVIFLAFGGGIFVGTRGVDTSSMSAFAASILGAPEPPEGVDLTPLWRAWEVIGEKYVATQTSTSTELVTDQDRVWGMIQGLAASLGDPYTVFLPPSEAEIFQDDISGSFEGVGMEIAIRDNVLTVVSPLKGTPSDRAGIEAGDRITEIDSTSTRGMGIDEAVRRIRGPRGTDVVFSIMREGAGEPLEISVTRDVINIPTIETFMRPDGIFVIELMNFSAVSTSLFRDALREFVVSGSNKLILDLRGNPGGYLGAAVDMASWFLPSGQVIVTEDYGEKGSAVVHRSRGYNIFNDSLEMVILIDRGSASASEILAGALQHHGIATLVGTNTFGKGSVQELVPITSDTSLKITVARWLLPGGNSIPDDGLAPDMEVPITEEQADAEEDPQLEKAVEILLAM
jgi:carboxyl-terminal processing protease